MTAWIRQALQRTPERRSGTRLWQRTVVPLLGVATILFVLVSGANFWMARRSFAKARTERSMALARTFVSLAETVPHMEELQNALEAFGRERVMGPSVALSGQPLTVIAATEPELVGLSIDRLRAQGSVGRILADAAASRTSGIRVKEIDQGLLVSGPWRPSGTPATDGAIAMISEDVSSTKGLTISLVVGLFSRIASYLAMCFAALLLIQRRVVRPVEDLARAVRRRRDGDAGAFAEVRSRDELGALSSAFNELVADHDAAVKEARSNAAFLDTVLDTVGDGILTVDSGGLICSANAAAHRLYGYEDGDLVGMEAGHLVAPEESCQMRAFFESMAERTDLGSRFRHLEGWGVRKDGSTFLRSVELSEAMIDGRRVMVAVVRDISEQKRAEQAIAESELRFRTLIENSSDVIAIADLTGRIAYVSPNVERLLGPAPAGAPLGFLADFVHPDDACQIDELLETARESSEFQVTLMVRSREFDGLCKYFECIARNYDDGSGHAAIHITAHDVTMRIEAEDAISSSVIALAEAKQMAEMQAELLQAQNAELKANRDRAVEEAKAKSEFLANISHEIRTPLNGILGLASLLRDTTLAPEQREYAEAICSRGGSLVRIIDDVLDFTMLEGGQITLERTAVDVNAELQTIVELFDARAASSGIDLRFEPDRSMPAALRCDAQRLKQVVFNLVDNALKFTEQGTVTVRTDSKPSKKGLTGVRVTVRDTGIGIPVEAQSTIFESFRQADGGDTRRFGGTGLGLVIVRQLVGLMGGEVGFESALGVGTEFYVDLSLESATPSAASAEASGPGESIECDAASPEARRPQSGAASIDPCILHSLTGGDRDLEHELVEQFCEYAREIFDQIETRLQEDRLTEIADQALALSSSANTLGASKVREECRKLQLCAASDDLVEVAQSLERIRVEVATIASEYLAPGERQAA